MCYHGSYLMRPRHYVLLTLGLLAGTLIMLPTSCRRVNKFVNLTDGSERVQVYWGPIRVKDEIRDTKFSSQFATFFPESVDRNLGEWKIVVTMGSGPSPTYQYMGTQYDLESLASQWDLYGIPIETRRLQAVQAMEFVKKHKRFSATRWPDGQLTLHPD